MKYMGNRWESLPMGNLLGKSTWGNRWEYWFVASWSISARGSWNEVGGWSWDPMARFSLTNDGPFPLNSGSGGICLLVQNQALQRLGMVWLCWSHGLTRICQRKFRTRFVSDPADGYDDGEWFSRGFHDATDADQACAKEIYQHLETNGWERLSRSWGHKDFHGNFVRFGSAERGFPSVQGPARPCSCPAP